MLDDHLFWTTLEERVARLPVVRPEGGGLVSIATEIRYPLGPNPRENELEQCGHLAAKYDLGFQVLSDGTAVFRARHLSYNQ